MRVIHITRRRMALLSLALGMVIGSALLLAGSFSPPRRRRVWHFWRDWAGRWSRSPSKR